MTDAAASHAATTEAAQTPVERPLIVRVLVRMPATLVVVAAILIAGVAWGGLWSNFEDNPLFDSVAYGLPAFQAGQWWTPLTGTFFVNLPWVYILTIAGFAGMGYLEFRRGTRTALLYFGGGQLFAVLGAALFFWLAAMLPWPWAQYEALLTDVGPSGGTMACIAAAIGLLVAPWRTRAWLVLLAFLFVAVLFWGALADVEHAVAVLGVLAVDRSLRVQRTTVREQRLVGSIAILTLGAVQILTLLTPTSGPFGDSAAGSGSWWDVAIDTVVILLVATGLNRGRRWAWVVTILLSVLNMMVGALLVVAMLLLDHQDVELTIDGDPTVPLATAVLWTLVFIYLILVRRAFQARRRSRIGTTAGPGLDEVKEDIRQYGGGTLSWMSTWGGNNFARTTNGVVVYQRRAGVALALADPLGPEEHRAESVREFIDMAERAGLIPCFFSASEATQAAVPDSWRSLVVADDTIVDLPGLAFTGKQWNSVRTAMNKAGREEMTFRMTQLKKESWGVQQQIRAISEMWVGDKGLPEMGFTLGSLDEATDPEVRLAIAVSPEGDIDGFLSWLPVYGGDGEVRGWTLDLMRRRDGGFGPVMEFLIGSSARLFSEEGAQIMSLSGAPLAHDYPPDAGMIADLSDKLADSLEPLYGFQSLHRFKMKFNPRFETMYLLFHDEGDLTRIAAALTRAFLPDATLRQFAGAGIELVRGSGKD
ncbi:bifunctional lysylphosphatidylglycerol flippase/synthetase MprF [uncultured Microbacterium sp.]|uniref:bifunctional lysylphosphatidylglycerol flippase/synthetase MprF n=1 Tax=uncultured Microbacterium sp. TaxID=191216 RepID=UPI0035CBD660